MAINRLVIVGCGAAKQDHRSTMMANTQKRDRGLLCSENLARKGTVLCILTR